MCNCTWCSLAINMWILLLPGTIKISINNYCNRISNDFIAQFTQLNVYIASKTIHINILELHIFVFLKCAEVVLDRRYFALCAACVHAVRDCVQPPQRQAVPARLVCKAVTIDQTVPSTAQLAPSGIAFLPLAQTQLSLQICIR